MVRFKVQHCRRDSILTYASVAIEQMDLTEKEIQVPVWWHSRHYGVRWTITWAKECPRITTGLQVGVG